MSNWHTGVVTLATAAVFLALAACRQAPPDSQTEASAVAEENGGKTAIEDQPEPQLRSILRQPVEVEPVVIQPVELLDVVVNFPNGGSRLDDAARQALDELADAAVLKSGGPITLRGHSDSRGSDSSNRRVSKERAQAVAKYLASLGVDAKRMTVIALGEDRPIAPNAYPDGSDNPAGRAKNRRVDVHVVPGDAAAGPTESAPE